MYLPSYAPGAQPGARLCRRLDVYAGVFNADLDDVAGRLDEAATQAAGVSQVCPEDGPEEGDERVREGGAGGW